jgi:hypothetical protein
MPTTARSWILFAVGHVLLAGIGVALLGGREEIAVFAGVLLLIMAVNGSVIVAFATSYDRHRPQPRLAVAPSGEQATFYPRSRFAVAMPLVLIVALTGWLAAIAITVWRNGFPGWSGFWGLLALYLFAALPLALGGRVRAGGLWLTRSGVQHRDLAVSWAVPWSGVLGVAAGEPIGLTLRAGAAVSVHRAVRWYWQPKPRPSEFQLGFGCTYLAGGNAEITAALQHYLDEPAARERLGTPQSLSRSPG